jgi:hypothetical protein
LDQAANIQLVADDLVRQLGPGAYAYSREFAEIAQAAAIPRARLPGGT